LQIVAHFALQFNKIGAILPNGLITANGIEMSLR